ncbi:uncharacterized protein [Venturia canescens]|uniref:uncharacterized protein n=1 Tax=Venturia canescens TaxID=32260 RepID=UPI001C9C2E98|nr:uncharacterized protein LOC122417328 [Venturia canescens]
MRIVYLIAVDAFLLSITIAESDWPVGLPGQRHHQHHHQKLLHATVLQPIMKSQTEKGPLDWLINIVSRVIKTTEKPPPPIIGPINLPRMGGRVYIRQLENYSPWQSNHVIIKMVTRDSVAEPNVPLEYSSSNHRSENVSRKALKAYSYQNNKFPWRSSTTTSQGYNNFSPANRISNWNSNYRSTYQHHFNTRSRLPTVQASNEFRSDEYLRNPEEYHRAYSFSSHNDMQDHKKFLPISVASYLDTEKQTSPVSTHSLISHQDPNNPIRSGYNNYSYRDSTVKFESDHDHVKEPDFSSTTLKSHSDYGFKENKNFSTKISMSNINRSELMNQLPSTFMRHKHVPRSDQMASQNAERDHFRQRHKADFFGSSYWHVPRNFRQGPMIKFEIDDVRNSEIMTVPDVQHIWDHEQKLTKKKNSVTISEKLVIDNDEDSINMKNGGTLKREESAEHRNDVQTDSLPTEPSQSRLLTYETIVRHRDGQNNRNISVETTSDGLEYANRKDDMKYHRELDEVSTTQKADREAVKSSNIALKATHGVTKLLESNRWRFQERRQPTRVVKAVYRRKPKVSIMRNDEKKTKSNGPNKEAESHESFLEN